MYDPKIEFFEKAVELVREMKQNLEGLALDAKKAGLDDLPFDIWSKRLLRWEKHFQGRILKVHGDGKGTRSAPPT
jgi:hypothetical protein